MPSTTRGVASIINNFAALTTLTDYPSDSETIMSTATIISDNTNHFARKIIISNKVGNSLFKVATAGLEKDDKLNFEINMHNRLKE